MRFDDRIATALAQPAAGQHDRAVRWRQLVDLVARSGGQADPAVVERAIAVIRADAKKVDEPMRAAAARAIAGMSLPLPLLAAFAADKLTVAAPVLAAAQLEGEALSAVRDAASAEVRRFLDSLRPPVAPPAEPPLAEPPPPEKVEHVPSISEVVARIERLRSSREDRRIVPPSRASVVPDLGEPALFRWECSPSGEIEWVEGAPRGPLVGRTIATADPDEGVDDCVERAFGVRAPFRDCMLELGEEGPLAGQWVISGVPAFAPVDGRFIGYRGIARRGPPEPPAVQRNGVPMRGEPADHEALREMIHEIKTPLNAIIGFAEIIDGQFLGPAHSRYRERAAEIVANARSLLQAAEDLDFAARLQSSRGREGEGTDLASFFPPFADDLRARAARRGVTVDLVLIGKPGQCVLEPELTERLLKRFTEAVIDAAEPSEHLAFRVEQAGQQFGLGVTRPRATLMAGKEELLDPEFTIGDTGGAMLGLGFSLRLINGLVGIAGGGLDIAEEEFTLLLPVK